MGLEISQAIILGINFVFFFLIHLGILLKIYARDPSVYKKLLRNFSCFFFQKLCHLSRNSVRDPSKNLKYLPPDILRSFLPCFFFLLNIIPLLFLNIFSVTNGLNFLKLLTDLQIHRGKIVTLDKYLSNNFYFIEVF